MTSPRTGKELPRGPPLPHQVHRGFIIPLARHFLSRLHTALFATQQRRWTTLRTAQQEDLRLWLRFLQSAHDGISHNLISCHKPTCLLRTDACMHGIGGYSLHTGIAWRWELPPDLRDRATLNTLEFLSSYVGIYMEKENGNIEPLEVLLAQTDSTSAVG